MTVVLYERYPNDPVSFWSSEADGSCIKQAIDHMAAFQKKPENKKHYLTAVAHNGIDVSNSFSRVRI